MIETTRLHLRRIVKNDFQFIKMVLQNPNVMYAWEHTFTDAEVYEWIEKNIERYEKDGFSYLAALEKETGDFVGVIGPLVEHIHGLTYIGVAYMLMQSSWHKGYATEGVKACLDYAFDVVDTQEVIAQIRPMNKSSIKVAERVGMKMVGSFIKEYKGKEMEHLIYCINRDEYMNMKG